MAQRPQFRFPWPVVLASGSPRRRELLAQLVPDFEVVVPNLDEDALGDPDPFVTAQRLAKEKALAVRADRPEALIVAGDTVVALPEEPGWVQLAKPQDEADAVRMLEALAGQSHTVVTGVCLVWPGGLSAFTESSEVTFRRLEPAEIEAYVATGQPMDKAGAYGLQDDSHDFVAQVRGSVTNVIGLPVERLEQALREV